MKAGPSASRSDAAAAPSIVKVAISDAGSVVCIEGRGTMRQSPTVREFICRLLGADAGTVDLDLGACTYLDSTFLGCILDLHKHYGTTRPPRFKVTATPAQARKLFGSTRLDMVLNISDTCAPVNGAWHTLPTKAVDAREVARHVMQCHRFLSEVEGPNQAAFARIADQMGKEMLNAE